MKTIKEIEKDLMQQDMQKILNKYHNGVYEKEARIILARQDAEASVPFRKRLSAGSASLTGQRNIMKAFRRNCGKI